MTLKGELTMAKVRIQVLGGVNRGLSDDGSCQGCGPVYTGQREYAVIQQILADWFGPEEQEMEYIKTRGQDPASFPAIDQTSRLGDMSRMVVINGERKWSGSIPLGAIIEVVKAELAGALCAPSELKG